MGALDSIVRRWIRAAHIPTEDLVTAGAVTPQEQVEMTVSAVTYDQLRQLDEERRANDDRLVSINEVVERR